MLNPTFAGIQALRKDLVQELGIFPLLLTADEKAMYAIVITDGDIPIKSPLQLNNLDIEPKKDKIVDAKLLNREYPNILLTDNKRLNWILFTQFSELGKFTSCGIIHSDTPAMNYYVEERLEFINENIIKKTWWNQYHQKYIDSLISAFSPRLSFVYKEDKLVKH